MAETSTNKIEADFIREGFAKAEAAAKKKSDEDKARRAKARAVYEDTSDGVQFLDRSKYWYPIDTDYVPETSTLSVKLCRQGQLSKVDYIREFGQREERYEIMINSEDQPQANARFKAYSQAKTVILKEKQEVDGETVFIPKQIRLERIIMGVPPADAIIELW